MTRRPHGHPIRGALARRRARPLPVVLVLLTAACGSPAPSATASDAPADPAATELTVFAAASLTESFTELGKDYENAHPGAKVTFSFAGSQALVQQVQQGAPADVVALADAMTGQDVAAELSGPAEIFAKNRLAIVTEKGNPLGITTLADLADPSRKVVLAAPAVPVGKAAAAALKRAGVTVAPVSQEQDVKAVLQKVRLGEADAGIVYVTDVRAAGEDVAGVDLPGITNSYPIATVTNAGHPEAASAFVSFVLSGDGQTVLSRYGFLGPDAT